MYARAPAQLGQLPGLDIARSILTAATGAPGGGGAPAPAPPGVAPATTTISPAFQQQFTPQVSPVFQQAQDSPGAVQAATATQHAPGGQAARGGSSSVPGAGDFAALPGAADFPPSSVLPTYQDRYAPQFPDAVRDVLSNRPFDWTPLIWAGGFITVIVVASMFLGSRRKR